MVSKKGVAHSIEVENADGVTIYYQWTNSKTELSVCYRGSSWNAYSNEYVGTLSIPASVVYQGDTYPVTGITGSAFANCETLTSVVIPESITSIAGNPFSGCRSLTSIEVKTDNTVYDSRDNCNAIIETSTNTLISGCQTTTIPNSIVNIGSSAFYNCTSLETIELSDNVISIGESAFRGCNGLTSIQISNNITVIDKYVFYESGLTSISIPDQVTTIKTQAFYGCANLASVSLPTSLTDIYEEAFSGCSSLSAITFPDGLFRIRKYAFKDCTSLTSIELPGGLYDIASPFEQCSGIREIIANRPTSTVKNVKTVGGVGTCTGLETVILYSDKIGFTICDNIQNIYSHIESPSALSRFNATTKQTATLYVPKEFSFKYQETDGWNDFTNIIEAEYGDPYTTENITTTAGGQLESIITSLETTRIKKLTIQGPLNANDIAYLRSGGEKMKEILELDMTNMTLIPSDEIYVTISGKNDDGLLNSGYTYNYYISDINYTVKPTSSYYKVYGVYNNRLDCLFRGATVANNLRKVIWPKSVTAIGDGAFYETDIEEVVASQPIVSVGGQAFYGSQLTTLTADLSQLEFCGKAAFMGTPYLSSLLIQDGVKYVGNVAYCIEEDLTGDLIFRSGTVSIADNFSISSIWPLIRYYSLSGVTSVHLPSSLKSIGDEAFRGSGLGVEVAFPEGLLSIGNRAFSGCAITSINIPSTLKTIGSYAFSGNSLTSLEIPSTVEHIGQGAFYNNQLTTLNYDVEDANPEKIYTVDDGIFGNNENLESLTIGSHVKCISERMFNNCISLKEITIPANVESIGSYPFGGCTAIETMTLNQASVTGKIIDSKGNTTVREIILGEGVKTIEESAFESFTALESINIPSKLTSIGAYAFYGCTNLSSALTIPDGVTELPREVFRNCTSLTSVTLPAQMTSIGHGAFNNCPLESITIPEGLTEIAPYTFNLNHFSSVVIPEGITTIGEGAFRSNSYLQAISFPSTLETIGDDAFIGIDIEELEIPANVVVGRQAFASIIYLHELTIGQGVSIGEIAFRYCQGLRTVNIADDVNIGKDAFQNCYQLKTVTTGENVTIGQSAFANCPVSSVTAGKEAFIGNNAFEGCDISTLLLSEDVVIRDYAFKDNTSLTSLHVPLNVWISGTNAFSGCTSLDSLVFERNKNYIGSGAFTGCPISAIRLLDASYDTYHYLLQSNKGTTYAPFDNTTYENAILTVPGGSKQIFSDSSKSKWSDFTHIEEEADTDISEIDNTLYINNVEGYTGRQLTLSIRMKNEIEAEGFQFDLYVPEGVTFAKDTNNRILASLSTARTTTEKTNSFSAAIQNDGALRVVAASTNGSAISGNDGEVAKVVVNISNDIAEGDYSLLLRNITISGHQDAGSYDTDLIKSTLTIASAPYILGDANGDGKVNVSDFTAIAHHILGATPVVFNLGAADVNEDTKVNVADLTAVAHLILYGSIERPNDARHEEMEEMFEAE